MLNINNIRKGRGGSKKNDKISEREAAAIDAVG